MSSSQPKSTQHQTQDYIARIRYSNALPPPPNPPKLLDIPNTGLASGQYTNPGFASRLAREQPLNIEADAELGMPLDLVGMPGVFDGDESSIQAPAQAPPVHPHDRALLRPLSTLGKPKSQDTSVSFLRRTEYISSVQARPRGDPFLKPAAHSSQHNPALRRPEKRKASPEPGKGTPSWIKRRIEKSFEVAAANLQNRASVKHPSKRNLRCVDAFPVLPDLDAFPDSGAYVTVQFAKNPVSTSTSAKSYDTRMLSGILKPIERTDAEEQALAVAQEAHERDPSHVPPPTQMMNYQFFLPVDTKTGERFRAKFDVDNPDKDSEDLYTDSVTNSFRFEKIRAYETREEKELNHDAKYDDEVLFSFRDESRERTDADAAHKAVYYYPIMQRTVISARRGKNIAGKLGIKVGDDEKDSVDQLLVRVDEPGEGLKRKLLQYKLQPIGELEVSDDEEDEDNRMDEDRVRRGGGDEDSGDDRGSRGNSGGGGGDDDEDAEGEEDDY
ncbi:RNA polymerase II-associated protein 1 [Podospora fimiseda]|uniref:RNA polymerase II-associated protein 1 n=1 Tax=Podospora fimiseda TaxID=252190 RepID=A0AAN7BWR3_9PEZI|nr:RNA polymerase II-associated protein 1 [Podospora fimiseda]